MYLKVLSLKPIYNLNTENVNHNPCSVIIQNLTNNKTNLNLTESNKQQNSQETIMKGDTKENNFMIQIQDPFSVYFIFKKNKLFFNNKKKAKYYHIPSK